MARLLIASFITLAAAGMTSSGIPLKAHRSPERPDIDNGRAVAVGAHDRHPGSIEFEFAPAGGADGGEPE